MRFYVFFLLSLFPVLLFSQESFKTEQNKYPRVRNAYSKKMKNVEQMFTKHAVSQNSFSVYLRVFKEEQEVELWAKDSDKKKFQLLKTYDICSSSGEIGPKRQEGDFQVPEGFYRIDRFNPYSNFYLSLGINYPNKSDGILGVKGKLGGEIFIHGNCVTIGCIPITDEEIMELYIICVEAKKSGQKSIPVTIFPKRLTAENFKALKEEYKSKSDKIGLWSDLKKGFDLFNNRKTLPSIGFLNNGRHKVE